MYYHNSYKIIQENYLKRVSQVPDCFSLYDFSELVYISSLGLFKMLRHTKAGIPLEVMGLMLGEYTSNFACIFVKDIFAMPQTGTGISVEAIDPIFQTKMLEMLRQSGMSDITIGWYHSHPGFGCWLSGVDINTQQNFEYLNQRSIAIVIDPIQSTQDKIIIEAFRSYPAYATNQQTRDLTCVRNLIDNLMMIKDEHGLNKYYYSLNIVFKITNLEHCIFSSLYEKMWTKKNLTSTLVDNFQSKIHLYIYEKIILLLKKFIFNKILLYNVLNMKFIRRIESIGINLKSKFRLMVIKIILVCIKKTVIHKNYV
ncbi:26S proteasome regulatory subunit (nucleomorph) [Cryptomonas paramecium]|uniref:COP9 signalosome complex subunit 5 n=1 Tax=Cryptomonas paramaecium TaxID=2898 RepID=F2HHI1_9CRYP|nr:26S proteasome regulatory subunit [Cryptomonas paramecium]AEA38777.1 26S proteasome regulatory subunit [Cryptomonas paramecium]|mmetsp:Transcript_16193/g.43949  ORF Transcript_16193/g.43949 Transcript_16193/m.43949 type:complete len:312 (-) Transcript_16193:391-1326(-)